jgi:hypothetical protein
MAAAIPFASAASAARPPTHAELKAITASLRRQNGGATVSLPFVSVSTAAPGWVAIGFGPKPYSFSIFHRRGTEWVAVGAGGTWPGRPFDGLCAYAPTAVVLDLFRIHCPPYRALHALPAPKTIRKTLTAALLAAPIIKRDDGGFPSRVTVFNACVSRLDSRWAGAAVAFPDTGLIAWFHETGGHWHVFTSWQLAYPPHAPVLSLASCVVYDAAEFGA